MSMNLIGGLLAPGNFSASPASWAPYQTFAPQLSGAGAFPSIARSGAGLLGGLTEPVVNAAAPRFAFPTLQAGLSGAQGLGGLTGATAAAPGFVNSLSAVEGGGGLAGSAGATAARAAGGIEGALGNIPSLTAIEGAGANAGKAGLLKGLLAKPFVKGSAYGVGAQLLANQFLAPGLRNMIEEGGTKEDVGQFGLGAIKSLPLAVGTGFAVGGPVGALAGLGVAGAAGVADAVFNFDKGKPKAPDAFDTFTQAVANDPTWTLQDKTNMLSNIQLAKASGAKNAEIIQSIIYPTVTQHQAQVQQYQQNVQQMQLQQGNLAGQSEAIGKAAQPILDLLAHNAEQGFDYRTYFLNAANQNGAKVDPSYAAFTADLASQQRDTQKLMAASLYQQAIAAPYQNYYNALNNQAQALNSLGSQVQNGYIQQAAQQFLDQNKSSTQSTIDQILSGVGQ